MVHPEGYRKALRFMEMAEKFSLPVFTFIDTPGAYPGVGAEERDQSEAIARNLFAMSQLKTPIICTVTGEGCLGGALGIGVGDRILCCNIVIIPLYRRKGCASILWKSADNAKDAAEAMVITAPRLKELGLIDDVYGAVGWCASRCKSYGASIARSIAAKFAAIARFASRKSFGITL